MQSLEELGATRINIERLPLRQVETFLGEVIGLSLRCRCHRAELYG